MMDFGMGIFGMVLFWGLIIAAIFFAIYGFISLSKDSKNQEQSYMEILRNRYAAGQISLEELEKIKKDLEKKR